MKFWWFPFIVLGAVVAATYGHTLDAPFYLDDFSSIKDNPAIYDLGNFEKLWRFSPLRFVGTLSFSFNFYCHKFQVQGYHIANVFIHFLVGCSILFFVKSLLYTPAIINRYPVKKNDFFPLLVALLFVLHPLQTQAVTYIVQRLASLTAFFYIASMACYVNARLNSGFER
ncbi:hypothetical protein KJ766_00235, partial [Patescibacteria group bacterium]|nr:hypothetical protein [Patescibacteria group bacterium]